MYEIDEQLERREREGAPIQVALVGAGQMGSEIVTVTHLMRGMDVRVVVDRTEELAKAGYRFCEDPPSIVVTNKVSEARRALRSGKSVATSNLEIAFELDSIESVVDATGSTSLGANLALRTIQAGKHIVMMNVECDVTVGPMLRSLADSAGVIYSLAAGDEPAAIIELYRFARAIGFEVVAAGKGKNNPLDLYATPESVRTKAKERNMSPYMLAEFVDGSKTAVEMVAVSNATGLVPDIPGMHGAKSTVDTLNRVFVPQADGGILERPGIVDFAVGVNPGVFVVVSTPSERIREAMRQREMGTGPYYTLFRPYHLCSLEVPLTIAQGVIYGESSGHPRAQVVSECIAVSKRQISAGEQLDRIGGYCYRGSIIEAREAQQADALPIGLAEGCIAATDIPADTPMTNQMVRREEESTLYHLRKLQDQLSQAK